MAVHATVVGMFSGPQWTDHHHHHPCSQRLKTLASLDSLFIAAVSEFFTVYTVIWFIAYAEKKVCANLKARLLALKHLPVFLLCCNAWLSLVWMLSFYQVLQFIWTSNEFSACTVIVRHCRQYHYYNSVLYCRVLHRTQYWFVLWSNCAPFIKQQCSEHFPSLSQQTAHVSWSLLS